MTFLLACKKCAAPLDARRSAALQVQFSRNVLLDLACGQCGRRALYDLPGPPPVRPGGTGPVRAGLNSSPSRL